MHTPPPSRPPTILHAHHPPATPHNTPLHPSIHTPATPTGKPIFAQAQLAEQVCVAVPQMFCRQHLRDGDRQQAQLAEGGLRAKQYFKMRRHKEPEHKLERVEELRVFQTHIKRHPGAVCRLSFGRAEFGFKLCASALVCSFGPRGAENKERLGRGGRLTEKRAPKEVQKAKGRDMASHGTFSRPRTVKVSNIPEGLEWRYIKELFESAAGKVIEGQFEEDDGVAWLTFEKPDAASTAHFDFDGGELADQVIKVELIDED
ncbi:unnamed protein product [Symbiodinium sp. KB8]|nr:unnamed protein product [Symbiodinium sp. KB8]